LPLFQRHLLSRCGIRNTSAVHSDGNRSWLLFYGPDGLVQISIKRVIFE
jgi:hypothetical protein